MTIVAKLRKRDVDTIADSGSTEPLAQSMCSDHSESIPRGSRCDCGMAERGSASNEAAFNDVYFVIGRRFKVCSRYGAFSVGAVAYR